MSNDLDKAAVTAKKLPKRQQQVLDGLGRCESRKQIAARLKISKNTVDVHCKILYARLGIHCLSQAIQIFHALHN
jgi:DNA-binding NarL/FixJ family response regulator